MFKDSYPSITRFMLILLGILAVAPAKASGLIKKIALDPKYQEAKPDGRQVAIAKSKNIKLSKLSAHEQRDILWGDMLATQYASPLPTHPQAGQMQSLHMLNHSPFLTEIFSKDHTPYAHEGFIKYTHQYGTVAQVEFIPTVALEEKGQDSEVTYSGLFSKPSIGLLRLSQITIGSMGSVNPSSAWHFLIDGAQMVSVVGMPSIDGQPQDPNFFRNPFTNIPGPANKAPATLIIDTFTSTLKSLPDFNGEIIETEGNQKLTALSLLEPASILPNGRLVSPERIHTPFEISLEAPSAVVQMYESVKDSGDFRDLIAQQFKAGTVIFEVYARNRDDASFVWLKRWYDKNNSAEYYKTGKIQDFGRKKLIGVIKTTSNFVSSQAGDRLRARHAH